MKKLNIGLFGFGVVGEGIYQVLEDLPQFQSTVCKIAIKQADKKRNAPDKLFTTDANDILNDPGINLVVELIDDAEAALEIVRNALKKGKAVVSANKKMIAENLAELLELQHKHNTTLLYEAAVCGSIPIIRNLEEYFDNDLLASVSGIVNGSSNFILTEMTKGSATYKDVLAVAQEKGFAESDPSLDVEGMDAAYKLSIIILHAFGQLMSPKNILRKGITSLHEEDFLFAKEKNKTIKLIAHTFLESDQSVHAAVLPTFVKNGEKLSTIDNEYNAVLLKSSLADEQFFSGKGAGRFPTSSAVLSDISALRYDYKYEYKRKKSVKNNQLDNSLQKKKCYLSFPTDLSVDLTLFEQIVEEHYGENRNYVIGWITPETWKNHEQWKNEKLSVIILE